MNKKVFARLDADNVGDRIELLLLKEKYLDAQTIHNQVQKSMIEIRRDISKFSNSQIIMYGSDDVLFSLELNDNSINLLEELRSDFFNSTKSTLSIGVGNSISQAIQNLRIAKLSGKNKIVGKL